MDGKIASLLSSTNLEASLKAYSRQLVHNTEELKAMIDMLGSSATAHCAEGYRVANLLEIAFVLAHGKIANVQC